MQRLAFFLLLFLLNTLNTASSATECPRIISQSPYITHSLKWPNLDHCIVGVSRYYEPDRPRTGGGKQVVEVKQSSGHVVLDRAADFSTEGGLIWVIG